MKKGFVKFYNVFTDIDSVYRLDMKELYVYGYLRMLQSNAGDCLVTVDFLHSIMKDSFEDNVTRNKKKIISVVHSLINKNVIKCDKDKFGNKDMLLINFNDKVLSNGHEQVESSLILNIEMYQHLYIYVTVARYQNTEKKSLECSYTEWSNLLGLHRTTTINYIEQCEKLGLIYIKQGKYTQENVQNRVQLKQEKNKYSIYPFEDVEDKSVKVGKEDIGAEGESDIQKAITSFKTYKIDDKDHFPGETDYYHYLLAKENPDTDEKAKLIKVAEKRMENLKYNKMVKDYLVAAENKIANEKERYYVKLASESVPLMVHYDRDNDIRTPIDVVVLVDGKMIPYKNYDGNGNIEAMFYERYEYLDGVGELNPNTKYILNPTQEDIDRHRPCNNNGDWRSENDDI